VPTDHCALLPELPASVEFFWAGSLALGERTSYGHRKRKRHRHPRNAQRNQ
jgi:hypothetical protein